MGILDNFWIKDSGGDTSEPMTTYEKLRAPVATSAFSVSPWVPVALTAVSTISDIMAAQQEGEFKASSLRQNAQLARLQAEDAMSRGQSGSIQIASRAKSMIGSQRAALAAQGIDIGSGSALDIQANTAQLAEMDAMTVRVNAAREAWGFDVQAVNYENQARLAETAAENKIRSSLLTGGLTALRFSKG